MKVTPTIPLMTSVGGLRALRYWSNLEKPRTHIHVITKRYSSPSLERLRWVGVEWPPELPSPSNVVFCALYVSTDSTQCRASNLSAQSRITPKCPYPSKKMSYAGLFGTNALPMPCGPEKSQRIELHCFI